jgi:hypothetical protein
MSGFVQTLAGGVVGVAAVLAAQYLPGLFAPEPPAAGASAPAPADPFGPGVLLLAPEAAACPEGWAAAGEVALLTSTDYRVSAAQPRSDLGLQTAATPGWASVPFTLCGREEG